VQQITRINRHILFAVLLLGIQPAKLETELTYEVVPDIQRNDFTFTDGCGFISGPLARHLAKEKGLKDVPSVWQVYPFPPGTEGDRAQKNCALCCSGITCLVA
jgi:hypothetical protein